MCLIVFKTLSHPKMNQSFLSIKFKSFKGEKGTHSQVPQVFAQLNPAWIFTRLIKKNTTLLGWCVWCQVQGLSHSLFSHINISKNTWIFKNPWVMLGNIFWYQPKLHRDTDFTQNWGVEPCWFPQECILVAFMLIQLFPVLPFNLLPKSPNPETLLKQLLLLQTWLIGLIL